MLPRRIQSFVVVFTVVTSVFVRVYGQPKTEADYSIDKQRLLLQATRQYIFSISQGQVDKDSALLIASKIYNLSPFLIYAEIYSDGTPTTGSTLLANGESKQAETILLKSKGTDRTRRLLELGSYYLYRPGSNPQDLKQASTFIQEAIRDSEHEASPNWKIAALTLHAFLLNQSMKKEEGINVMDSTLHLAEMSGDKRLVAQTHLNKAYLLPFGHPARMGILEKARALFQAIGANEKAIETFSEITVEHFMAKRFDKAENCLKAVLQEHEKIGYHHNQFVYDVLAYLTDIRSDYTLAMTYANKSIESITLQRDSVIAPIFYARKAGIFMHIYKNDDAFVWFDKALEGKTSETRLFWYKAFFGKALLCTHLDRSQEALTLLEETGKNFPPMSFFEQMHFSFLKGLALDNLKRLDEAATYYNTFLAMAEHFPPEFINVEFPQALVFISRFYSEIGQTKKAKELLEKTRSFMHLNPMGTALFYEAQFKIDTTEHRYKQAVSDLLLIKLYSDSSQSIEQRKKAEELIVQYETEKKDKDIQLLRQEAELQQARLDQSNVTRNITVAGALLLLLIAGLLYYLYYSKQKSNKQLTHLLDEKEWLLKEIHHRVKNNLQTVLSLLESQSRQLSNEALDAIQQSQNRVYAMSLIHKKLYQSTDVSSINMEDYLRDLAQHLRDSFGSSSNVRFSLELEPVELDVSQAVPVGLIVNEAVTNALKYAFQDRPTEGEIGVSLKQGRDNRIVLLITDNGVGMTIPQENTQSLGLKLMRGLTEDIEGSFTMESHHGVTIVIEFIANRPFQKLTVPLGQAVSRPS